MIRNLAMALIFLFGTIILSAAEEIVRGDTGKKEVIFTFDGGSGIQSAEKILEILAKHRVKGPFFLTGKMIKTHPLLVKRIASSGDMRSSIIHTATRI